MATINCQKCRNKLGETCGDIVMINNRGRSVMARDIVRIECEKCGTIWEPVAVDPPGPARHKGATQSEDLGETVINHG